MGPSESHTTLELARKRIADIAVQHEVPAPMHLQEGAGAPSAEVMQIRKQTGVSSGYLFLNEQPRRSCSSTSTL